MVSSHRALVLSAAALFAVVSAQAMTPNFFGEIPIQYVGPGEKIVLDLHRFLHPPKASIHVDGPDAGAELPPKTRQEIIPPSAALSIGQR